MAMSNQEHTTGIKILSVVELLPLQAQAVTDSVAALPDIKDDQELFDIEEMINGIRHRLADYQDDQSESVVLVKAGSIADPSTDLFNRYACQASLLKERELVILQDNDSAEAIGSSSGSSVLQTILSVSEPEQRHSVMATYVRKQVAKTINIPISAVGINVSLDALGFDSLTAAELQKQIEFDLTILLPRLIFMRDLTMVQLSEWILEQLPLDNSNLEPTFSDSQEVSHTNRTSPAAVSPTLPDGFDLDNLWLLKQFASDTPVHNIPCAIEAIQSWMQNTGFVPDIALWGRYRFHIGCNAWSRCL